MKILLIGVDEPGHVGRFLLEGGQACGYNVSIANVFNAYKGNFIARNILWKLDRRPVSLKTFSLEIEKRVIDVKPDLIITTGVSPIQVETLKKLHMMGIRLVNYSTDDPWNPSHRASWFLHGLSYYHVIFTTRRVNIDEFKQAGCDDVQWLPFGYDPTIHYFENEASNMRYSDLAFVGGADGDRVPMIAQLIEEGVDVSLWGGYWHRYGVTRLATHGVANSATMRRVISGTRCALTLVRRANRDGHAMRTFEVAAIGAPMLVEDTIEHREMFGSDGKRVRYFSSNQAMLEGVRWFIDHPEQGREMADAVRKHIRMGSHTYGDRFKSMVASAQGDSF